MARRSVFDVDNSIMERNQCFTKSGLEENLCQYFSEHRGSSSNNYAETLAAQSSDFNIVPPCPAIERFGLNASNKNFQQVSHDNNTGAFGNKNHSQKERPSFKSYESSNYKNRNFVNDEGFSPKTAEYTSYNYPKNNLIENSLRYEPMRVFGNNNSDLNYTGNYEDCSTGYRNEDQLRNNTLFPLNRDQFRNDTHFEGSVNDIGTLPRNDQYFGGNFGTFGSCEDGSTNYSRFSAYQRDNVPPRSNSIPRNTPEFNHNFGPCDSVSRIDDCYSSNIIGNVGHSHDQSNNYELYSSDNVNEWKCVRNPEYFPVLSSENYHFSRDMRNEEQYRSNGISRKIRRHSEESILPRDMGRSRPSSYGRRGSTSRDEHEFGNSNNFVIRNERRSQRFRRNSRDDRHIKGYDSHRYKYSKIDKTHEFKTNRKYPYKKDETSVSHRSKSYKKNSERDISPNLRQSSTRRSSKRIDSNKISEIENKEKVRKNTKVSRNTDISSCSQYSRKIASPRLVDVCNTTASTHKPKTRKEKLRERSKLFIRKCMKKKSKALLQRRKEAAKLKAEKLELKDRGILEKPPKGQIKHDPEKYWKEWWSKFAYIERVIEKVDHNDETVKGFLKFRYDLNKTDLDSNVSAVLSLGLSRIRKTSNINEINYERRSDVYKTLKYKKLLEDKDFQTFLLPREQKTLATILQSLKNKKMLALLYQSIIHRWHISMELIKTEESGEEADKVKYANTLLNDKLFQYLVLDSIHLLKKLTINDWDEFNEFYNNLQ